MEPTRRLILKLRPTQVLSNEAGCGADDEADPDVEADLGPKQ